MGVILGVTTAIVDFFVHAGHEGGGGIGEALMTGVGAAVLSYVVGIIIEKIRKARSARAI